MRGEVESHISEFERCAKITTSSVLGEVTEHVKEVVEQSEAKTSHAIGDAFQ